MLMNGKPYGSTTLHIFLLSDLQLAYICEQMLLPYGWPAVEGLVSIVAPLFAIY